MENTLKRSSEDENMENFQVLPMSRVQDLQVYEEIEDQHSIVPFHQHESSLNWRMLAAILVIVTILGASIFASGQEEISTETIPDENSNDVDQLMEYSFVFLFGYCCSEVVNHLMQPKVFRHNFV